MMRLFVGQELAGILERQAEGFSFRYIDDYAGPPAFLNWPIHQQARHWAELPAELACCLPKGLQLEQWRNSGAADSSSWGLLAATGADLPGMVSVLPDDLQVAPLGREVDGLQRLSRARIRPELDALPYSEQELATSNSRAGFTHSLASRGACASAIYSRKESAFKLVNSNGSYRLLLEPKDSPGAIANQLLTSRLARDAGLVVAALGGVQTSDRVPVLWVERFDRSGAANCQRSRLESAAQLLGHLQVDPHAGSVEAVARLISRHCTNPKIQLMRFFHRVLFGWLTGNCALDLHKWSLLQHGSLIELSPAYGLMNHSIMRTSEAESALSIDGQCEALCRESLLKYFGEEVCGLNDRIIARVMNQLKSVPWEQRIQDSGLPKSSQRAYFELLCERWLRLL
ncbi:type II toxin-antitoxin system HipA family toxin [Coraliomargarita sp. W4R72]